MAPDDDLGEGQEPEAGEEPAEEFGDEEPSDEPEAAEAPAEEPAEDYGDEGPAEAEEAGVDYGDEMGAGAGDDFGDADDGGGGPAPDFGDDLSAGVAGSEVVTESWGSRLSSSIKGVVVGLLLFVAAFPVLWCNEGRAVKTARSLTEGRGAVVSASADSVDPANDQKLVHLSGQATTTDTLTDEELGASATAIKLRRKVEMYQWKEKKTARKTKKKIGGSRQTIYDYSYNKVWSESVIDSSAFNKKFAGKRRNPTAMKYRSKELVATNVAVGAFTLPESLIAQISKAEALTADVAKLPAALKSKAKPHAGGFYISDRKGTPADPKISDLKVTFAVVKPQVVSIIAQQAGDTLQPYQTKAGRALNMLSAGQVGADQMFTQAEKANVIMAWILRVVGLVMMAAGIGMVFNPLAVLADVLPILGDILRMGIGIFAFLVAFVLSLVTIAIAWLFYRPVLGILLLAVAVGAFIAVKKLGAGKKAQQAAQAAPAGQG